MQIVCIPWLMSILHKRLTESLLSSRKYIRAGGRINVSALAKAAGVPQPTVKRILDGESKSPKVEIVQKICDASDIKISDVYEGLSRVNVGESMSQQEQSLISIFRALSQKNKKLAIRLLSVLE